MHNDEVEDQKIIRDCTLKNLVSLLRGNCLPVFWMSFFFASLLVRPIFLLICLCSLRSYLSFLFSWFVIWTAGLMSDTSSLLSFTMFIWSLCSASARCHSECCAVWWTFFTNLIVSFSLDHFCLSRVFLGEPSGQLLGASAKFISVFLFFHWSNHFFIIVLSLLAFQ